MRILLVLPADSTYHYGGFFRRTLSYAPLTLSTLAGLVPDAWGCEIELLDEGVQPARHDGKFCDVVGITCVASSSSRAYALARHWRRRGAYVVLGGPHPTLVPGEAAGHADAVIAGPAEEAWLRLLEAFREGRPIFGVVRSHLLEQTQYTLPRRDLLPGRRYLSVPTVLASQGCPNTCSFCSVNHIWGQRFKARPVAEVIDEIRGLASKRILFLDPNLIGDREHALELFAALTPLKLAWGGLATLGLADDAALLNAAVHSGCRGLLIGYESMSQAALDASGKLFQRIDGYMISTSRIRESGISVLGCFVLGFDVDSVDDLRQLPDVVDALGIDIPRFAILTPFPGTALHKNLEQEGRILTDDLSLYDCEHAVYRPALMSPEQLEELLAEVWRKTYSLKRVVRRAWKARSDRLLALACNVGFRHYGMSLRKRWGRYNGSTSRIQ